VKPANPIKERLAGKRLIGFDLNASAVGAPSAKLGAEVKAQAPRAKLGVELKVRAPRAKLGVEISR
jgi:hypothetical protein